MSDTTPDALAARINAYAVMSDLNGDAAMAVARALLDVTAAGLTHEDGAIPANDRVLEIATAFLHLALVGRVLEVTENERPA